MTSESEGNQTNSGAGAPSGVNFPAFVLSLAHTAAVHLGDVVDPATGAPADQNLPAALQIIEILGLLDAKTRGNLTAEERQLLEQILQELRVRFADVKKGTSRIIHP